MEIEFTFDLAVLGADRPCILWPNGKLQVRGGAREAIQAAFGDVDPEVLLAHEMEDGRHVVVNILLDNDAVNRVGTRVLGEKVNGPCVILPKEIDVREKR